MTCNDGCGNNDEPTIINGNAQNYPAQGNYATYGFLNDLGMGVGSQITGQPYNVYRLSNESNGDVVQPSNLLYSNFPAWREQMTGKLAQGFEGTKSQEIFWFALTGDFSKSQVGDVFVLDDPVYGIGGSQVNFNERLNLNGFVLASHSGMKGPIGARIDRWIHIYRPATVPDSNGYLITTTDGAQPIVLLNGRFQVGVPGQRPARIPAGFLPIRRARGSNYPGIPDTAPHSNWSCYTVPLPGFTAIEADIIIASDTARYKIVHPFDQEVGTIGNQWTLEREVSSVGLPAN